MFYTDKCPICKKKLEMDYTPGYLLYECHRHYFFSQKENGDPSYCTINLFTIRFSYDNEATAVFRLNPDYSYKYMFTHMGEPTINWNDLPATDKRINKLLVFS